MDPTSLRNALSFLRRQWWVIAQAMLVIGAVTALLATREDDPLFQSSAVVQVQSEESNTNAVFKKTGAVIMAEEQRVLRSGEVIEAAARQVGTASSVVASSLSSGADPVAGYITITARSVDPQMATSIANAVADSYVTVRQSLQTGKLEEAIAAANKQLAAIEGQIATIVNSSPVTTPTVPDPSSNTPTPTTIAPGASTLETLNTQYSANLDNLLALERELQLKPDVVEVTQAAASAFQPAKKSPIKQGALGAGVGVIVGLGLAVLRELLDDRVHSRSDIEAASGLAVIATLPYDSASASTRKNDVVAVASLDRPHDALAEAIRQLRTSVSFLSIDQPISCVTITSAEPDEGKSLVAANLAVAFAQAGVDTILLSGDLRRPSLDTRMLPPGSKGLSDLILSKIDQSSPALRSTLPALPSPVGVDDVIYPTQIPNLRFVPAGNVPPNPAELLASGGAVTALGALRSTCQMLVIDSPPTLVADGVILANLADATLLVTAISQTHAARVASAVEALSSGKARVLGVVINKMNIRSTGYQSYAPIGRDERRKGHVDVSAMARAQAQPQPYVPPQCDAPLLEVPSSLFARASQADQAPAPAPAPPLGGNDASPHRLTEPFAAPTLATRLDLPAPATDPVIELTDTRRADTDARADRVNGNGHGANGSGTNGHGTNGHGNLHPASSRSEYGMARRSEKP